MVQPGMPADDAATISTDFEDTTPIDFVEMYREHAPGVLTCLRAIVPSHVAEEITHDVFVIVWNDDRYSAELGTRRRYLHGIARYKAIDWLRRQYTTEARNQRWAAMHHGNEALEESVCAADEAARVRRAVESLGRDKREAISLAYFGGLSYRQVAIALNVPEGTVKTRIRDGLTQLRQQLAGSGVSDERPLCRAQGGSADRPPPFVPAA